MAESIQNVYQFKITLKDSNPKIWHRIQVPENYSFGDLHEALQCAMGWSDAHLHDFKMKNPVTGRRDVIGQPPDEENDWGFGPEVLDETGVKIARYFTVPKSKASYIYDMGDGWVHDILLEKIVPVDQDARYPQCLAGKMACPPENSGGISGYERLLDIISDPEHKEHKDMKEWLDEMGSEDFNPNVFDPKKVHFF